ncbi:Urease accessory protein UreF [Methylobacterium crusticola]|uniref:Urease accessory protein UreF n=1 Tax=Methylobacterium crusticola TaxID=1697972 RepID=A0ABQ4QRH3_9HYPH|nr:urease accessory UreF family protein [Methylobacterium crusticola]GJD47834.1 Urease accessory protein UreF [Methylobacterium crusticola]
MAETVRDALLLLAWLSPGYPVGAYAYSHGLEWAVEAGDVRDEAGLRDWLADVLEHGAGRSDAILAAHAHAAAAAGDATALAAVNDLALALAPSRELHLETSQQGRSFLDATRAAWGTPRLAALADHLAGPVAYPVAVGAAAGAHGLDRPTVLAAYLSAFVQNLVSASLRLAPVGQSAGTRVVAALTPRAAALAEAVEGLALDAAGTATVRLDLGSFRHETQYTRIFRS